MSKAHMLMFIPGLAVLCSVALQSASNSDSPAATTMPLEYVCEPVAGRLDPDATLSDRAGRYRLTLVADVADTGGTVVNSSSAATRAVSGLLTLRRQARTPASSASPDSPDSPDSRGDVSTTLIGFTGIDPESVGAHRVGDPGSEDPSAPGVLVIEREEYGRRIITLRLGSDANRKDLVRYDGEYTVLSVSSIDEEGFSGSWRSGGGLGFTVTTGYFCAWEVP